MDTTPADVLRVMNCQAIKALEDLPRGEYLMEPKLDGFRLVAHVTPDGVRFYTRSLKRQDGKLPHLDAELSRIFPPGTVLDGEIVAMRFEGERIINNFEDVQSKMLSNPAVAVQKQIATGWLKFIVFDMMMLSGDDIRDQPYQSRIRALNAALGAAEPVHTAAMQTFPAEIEVHNALVDNGFEGSVIKNVVSVYSSGQRGSAYGWFKIKAQPTVDVIVIGPGKPGEGKNKGLVGSIRFGQPMVPEKMEGLGMKLQKRQRELFHDIGGISVLERGQCGGMDDGERQYITDHIEELVGTVIEIAHFGVFPGGVTLRMPQFKRFRPDKAAREVTWHDK